MVDRILVVGGAGFIGSHVCKALAASDFLPVVFDNLSGGRRDAVRWGPLYEGDMRDPDALDRAFKRHDPSAVIHLAGHIAAGESVVDPQKYYDANVGGFLSLLDAIRRHGVRSIVFSSSAAVYGDAADMPIRETAPMSPTNPYGWTKAMSEIMLQNYAVYGLNSVSLRYFNAAGADPDGEIGELHDPETHLIPLILEVAAGLRPHIDVFGTDHPTPDGTCIRDYVHVEDLASAHVLALRALLEGRVHGAAAYNLGNGQGYSVFEVIAAVEAVTGVRIPTRHGPARAGDPPRLVADSSEAERVLNWRQDHADLASQIAHAWAFLRTHRFEHLRSVS